MYHRATSSSLSPLRFLVVCAVLLLCAVKVGYGQRVYADSTASGATPILATVGNPGNASDNNYSNYSLLNIISLLGSSNAWQTLFFSHSKLPEPTSPVIIKFRPPGSLVGLGDGLQASRRLNGTSVGTIYSVNNTLDLLWLLSDGTDYEFIMPSQSNSFNGVRLQLNSVLGVTSARLYYAFYIEPPEIPTTVTACADEPAVINIAHYETELEVLGYTYYLYDALIGGNPIINISFNNGTLTLPATLPAGDYYLEARENDIYPSARTKITLIRNEVTGGVITGNQTLCANITPAQLSEITASTGTGPLTYQWQIKTTGGYTDITDATASTYTPPTLSETTMYRRATRSTINGVVCETFGNEITITVNPVPTISLNNSTINACQEDDTIDFPYNSVVNAPISYNINWNPTAQAMGFQDIVNKTHNFLVSGGNIPISIPPDATQGTYQGILTVRNSDGCTNSGQALIVNILPKPPTPEISLK